MTELNEGSTQFIANLILQRAQQADAQAAELNALANQFLNAESVTIVEKEPAKEGAEK